MAPAGTLVDYPGLARWFADSGGVPPEAAADRLVWRTCEALASGAGVPRFLDAFGRFLASSTAPLADFLAADELMHRLDASLVDLIGELGEAALRSEQAAAFFGCMRAGADATGLIFLRFLAAWIALNTGRLADCVSECERVDEPYAALYTIHGQALLEQSQAEEAAEVLAVAVKLSPGEILAWFQLAKAHHVLGRHGEAIAALRECRRLAPQSDEVALYLGLVAVEVEADPALAAEALADMQPAWRRHPSHPHMIFTLLRLAIRADDKNAARAAVAEADWPALMAQRDGLRLLPQALRDLHASKWHDVAEVLLGRVTSPVSA